MGLPWESSLTVTLPMTFTIAAIGKIRLRVRVGVSDALPPFTRWMSLMGAILVTAA